MNTFLSVTWNMDPAIFTIGSFEIRWYSLMFVIAFYLGLKIFTWFFKRENISDKLIDPLFYTMIAATFIGARLGHCFFYEPEYYLANPSEILKVWHGGLASHGGAIGILLALWWFVNKYGKKYDFDYLWLLDRMVIVIALAGVFIRLGNLCNSEIYGGPTDLPWGFIFVRAGETIPKHPTQLYEALSYLLIFMVLMGIYIKYLPKIKRGFIFGLFLVTLFGARFIIENIKNPQVDFEATMKYNMGQLLSIPFIIAGIILIIYSLKRGKPAMIGHQAPYVSKKNKKDSK